MFCCPKFLNSPPLPFLGTKLWVQDDLNKTLIKRLLNSQKSPKKDTKDNAFLLCVKGDDEDGGDDLAANGEPEDENRIVNVAQLSDHQNYAFQSS